MPSVIDSFSVAIGLDPKGAKKGAAEAQKAFKETESVVTKSAQGMAGAISGVIKEFIGLFLVVRSVQDVVHFFGELNHTIAQLGYDSKNFGESAAELRTWQQVAVQFGGTADGVSKSIAGINATLQDLQYNGVVNDQYRGFQRLGVAISDAKGDARDYKDILEDTADAIKRQGLSRPRAYSLLQSLGLDEGSINAILAGRGAIESAVKRERGTAAQTARGVEAARALENAWNDLKNTLTGVAAQVLNVVSPSIQSMFQGFGHWVQSHQKDIANGLKAVSDWANGDGPGKIIDALSQIADAMLNAANLINGFFGNTTNPSGKSAENAIDKANAYDASHPQTDATTLGNIKRTWAALDSWHDLGAALSNSASQKQVRAFETAHDLPAGALAGLNASGTVQTDPDAAAKILVGLQQQYAGRSLTHRFDPDVVRQSWKDAIADFRSQFNIPTPGASIPRANATPGLARGRAAAAGAAGSTTTVNIDQITVNTKATDAQGVGRGIKEATNKALVNTGNTGMN